ncbi:hypothetical protein RYX36_025009 [Vicia faba]
MINIFQVLPHTVAGDAILVNTEDDCYIERKHQSSRLEVRDPHREGACIISHAPGTGKTRLTIVFLMAYLKLFPKSHPVIVTPASLLLTWEDAFKKWDIGVPFHKQS